MNDVAYRTADADGLTVLAIGPQEAAFEYDRHEQLTVPVLVE
jgi:hypothetical protein